MVPRTHLREICLFRARDRVQGLYQETLPTLKSGLCSDLFIKHHGSWAKSHTRNTIDIAEARIFASSTAGEVWWAGELRFWQPHSYGDLSEKAIPVIDILRRPPPDEARGLEDALVVNQRMRRENSRSPADNSWDGSGNQPAQSECDMTDNSHANGVPEPKTGSESDLPAN